MAVTFFPGTDAKLLAWSLNFSTLITAGPTTYGLTTAQAGNAKGTVTNSVHGKWKTGRTSIRNV